MDEKSLSLLFPVGGGGAVVTNDWCITDTKRKSFGTAVDKIDKDPSCWKIWIILSIVENLWSDFRYRTSFAYTDLKSRGLLKTRIHMRVHIAVENVCALMTKLKFVAITTTLCQLTPHYYYFGFQTLLTLLY